MLSIFLQLQHLIFHLIFYIIYMSGFDGKDSGLASIVTLASSLDYTPSKSSLKWLLPLASDKRN